MLPPFLPPSLESEGLSHGYLKMSSKKSERPGLSYGADDSLTGSMNSRADSRALPNGTVMPLLISSLPSQSSLCLNPRL